MRGGESRKKKEVFSARFSHLRSGCVAARLAECLVLWFCVSLLCDRHRPSCVHPYRVGVPVVGRTVFRLPINQSRALIPDLRHTCEPCGNETVLHVRAMAAIPGSSAAQHSRRHDGGRRSLARQPRPPPAGVAAAVPVIATARHGATCARRCLFRLTCSHPWSGRVLS